jgi:serralysin
MSLGNNSTIQTSMGDDHYVISLLNSGYRWATDTVHYSYDGFTSAERAAIHKAMLAWGSVANLDFIHTTGKESEILFEPETWNLLNAFGDSGTPFQATDRPGRESNGYEFIAVQSRDKSYFTKFQESELGRVHTHLAMDAPPFLQGVKVGQAGFEDMMHEIGHALGLKHTFDAGSDDNNTNIFNNATKHGFGDFRLNQGVYTVMSYNTNYDPKAKNLDYNGYMRGPMAFDIAAVQQLYGARQHVNDNDSYYELFDSTASSSHMGWTSLWDTGGTDTIAYNGSFNAVIDLRPATLDHSATGGGMMSYTWRLGAGGRHIMTSQGYTIAGDISNAIADDNGVTGVLIEKAVGGNGTDRLTGNDAGNQLWGYDGVDTLTGGGGDDTLIGGAGADIVKGGSGDDTYRVDDAGDYITEMNFRHVDSGGVDLVRTKLSEYTLVENVRSQIENLTFIGSGSFTGTGNSLNNTIIGGGSDDTLIGGEGNDRLDGGVGADSMYGGAGDDTYVVNDAGDIVGESNGVADPGGNDTIETTLSFYSLADNENSQHIENLTLLSKNGAGGVGNALDNIITGNTGDDFLQGNDGNDTLIGMGGHDSLIGGTGDDSYIVNDTDAVIVEDAYGGVDTVQTHLATYTLHDDNVENLTFEDYYYHRRFTGIGNALNNAIRGGLHGDQLSGNDGDDYLYGNGGADSLQGGVGNDTLRGGIGDDVLNGGAGSDAADYHDTSNKTEINLSIGIAKLLKSDIETDTLISIENIIGSKGADKVVGDDYDNGFIYQGWYGRFSSSGGADTFDGAGGSDTVDFADFRVQMMSIDLTEGTAIGKYSVDSGTGVKNGSKTVVSFSHVENVVASRGDDTIIGDGNDNTFSDAGAFRYQHEVGGIDHYFGGGGDDTADFSRFDGLLNIDLERGDAQASYNVSVQGGGESAAGIVAYLTGIENVTASLDSDIVKGDDNDNTFSYVGSFTSDSSSGALDNYDGRGGSNTVDMSKFRGKTDIDLSAETVSSSYRYDNGEGGGTASTQVAAMTNIQNAVGSGFADTIEGSAEANKISGGGGSDRITGNGGDDRLTGGAGTDTFAFDSTISGNDVITDFITLTSRRASHDVLEFSTSVFIDWDHVLAATTDTDDGAYIAFDDNNNGVTLTGVTKQSLINHHEIDVVFV